MRRRHVPWWVIVPGLAEVIFLAWFVLPVAGVCA